MSQSRFIRRKEILATTNLTEAALYSLLGRNRIPGVKPKEDGSGYLISRRIFLKWLDQNPQYKTAQASQPVETAPVDSQIEVAA